MEVRYLPHPIPTTLLARGTKDACWAKSARCGQKMSGPFGLFAARKPQAGSRNVQSRYRQQAERMRSRALASE